MEIEFKTIAHFRQLGGIKTKDGRTIRQDMIFRSGELSDVSLEELKKLENLGIKTIYDLRGEHETSLRPDKEGNYDIVLCPLAKPFKKAENRYQNPASFEDRIRNATEGYFNYSRVGFSRGYMEFAYNTESVSKVLESLNRHEVFLYHCFAGKDRTGVISMLIMAIMGCDYETCKANYMYHNVIAKDEIEEHISKNKEKGYSEAGLKLSRFFYETSDELFDCAWYSVFDRYVTIEDYLMDQFGITKETVTDWRSFYLS